MVQGRSSLRFPPKMRERLTIQRDTLRQKFERDKTMQTAILGFVDNAHTAAAELFDNAIVGNGLAEHWWRNLTWECDASQ